MFFGPRGQNHGAEECVEDSSQGEGALHEVCSKLGRQDNSMGIALGPIAKFMTRELYALQERYS